MSEGNGWSWRGHIGCSKALFPSPALGTSKKGCLGTGASALGTQVGSEWGGDLK